MSQQPVSTAPAPRRQVRIDLERLRRSNYASMFGITEIIALGGAALVFIVVVISYLYFLLPARSNLEIAKQEKSRLQTALSSSKDVVLRGQTTEAAVLKITESLSDFETNQLIGRTQGRMALYEELNQLIRKNSLRNTSGPNYTPLQSSTARTNGATRSASAKWQSIYPGIAINVTVEGQYANLRRFIRDIEASRMFVVINGVELERATETNSSAPVEGEGAPRPALVSLRLDLATYFQRGTEEVDGTSLAQ